MTLGITPAGIPGLSIYSASTDQAGDGAAQLVADHRRGAGPAGEGRTMISGVLIDDQPVRGVAAAEPVGGQRDRPAAVRIGRHRPGAEDARGRIEDDRLGERDRRAIST